jgi:hypothetical protein
VQPLVVAPVLSHELRELDDHFDEPKVAATAAVSDEVVKREQNLLPRRADSGDLWGVWTRPRWSRA